MQHKEYQQKATGEGVAIRQIGVNVYEVESFENPGMFYRTNLNTQTCDCPASRFGYGCVKHLVLADAIARIPARPGASVIIARLVELCRAIFEKNATPEESYATLNAVLDYRYSTEAMRRAARVRHGKVVA